MQDKIINTEDNNLDIDKIINIEHMRLIIEGNNLILQERKNIKKLIHPEWEDWILLVELLIQTLLFFNYLFFLYFFIWKNFLILKFLKVILM